MAKKFAKNFGISLLVYFVISLLGYVGIIFLVGQSAGPVPIWIETVLWLHVLISAASYFWLGTKLKLLGNHLLNFISVSGGIAFALLLVLLDSYALFFTIISFFWLYVLIIDNIDNHYILYILFFILLALPSLITWLGMVYQAKRNKRIGV